MDTKTKKAQIESHIKTLFAVECSEGQASDLSDTVAHLYSAITELTWHTGRTSGSINCKVAAQDILRTIGIQSEMNEGQCIG